MIPSSHHPSLTCKVNTPSVYRWVVGSPACKERAQIRSKAYVYLLRGKKTATFYVGWTTNIKRRMEEHNSGESQYTKSRGPWVLMGYETYSISEEAKKRERVLKRNPRMLFYFKKRALECFFKGSVVRPKTQRGGMIPSPLYPPKAESTLQADKEVMG